MRGLVPARPPFGFAPGKPHHRSRLLLGSSCIISGLIAAAPARAGETITYSFDNRGRLTAVDRTGSIDDMSTGYTYDNADNRTKFTSTGVSGGTTPYPNVVTQDPDGSDSNWNDDGSDSGGWGGDGVAVDPGADDGEADGSPSTTGGGTPPQDG